MILTISSIDWEHNDDLDIGHSYVLEIEIPSLPKEDKPGLFILPGPFPAKVTFDKTEEKITIHDMVLECKSEFFEPTRVHRVLYWVDTVPVALIIEEHGDVMLLSVTLS